MDKRAMNTALLAMLYAGMTRGVGGYMKPDIPPQPKICLNCGKEHFHNNSYCSAECCKAYREKQRRSKQ